MVDKVTILTAENYRDHLSANDGLVLIYKNHCPHCKVLMADILMHTNCPGVFAAGDVVAKKYRQLTTAMSDGTVAALEAVKYIRSAA